MLRQPVVERGIEDGVRRNPPRLAICGRRTGVQRIGELRTDMGEADARVPDRAVLVAEVGRQHLPRRIGQPLAARVGERLRFVLPRRVVGRQQRAVELRSEEVGVAEGEVGVVRLAQQAAEIDARCQLDPSVEAAPRVREGLPEADRIARQDLILEPALEQRGFHLHAGGRHAARTDLDVGAQFGIDLLQVLVAGRQIRVRAWRRDAAMDARKHRGPGQAEVGDAQTRQQLAVALRRLDRRRHRCELVLRDAVLLTVVLVSHAGRERPLADVEGVLHIGRDGLGLDVELVTQSAARRPRARGRKRAVVALAVDLLLVQPHAGDQLAAQPEGVVLQFQPGFDAIELVLARPHLVAADAGELLEPARHGVVDVLGATANDARPV